MPDAIVIGAGPNGLTAANVLADAGWSVLVLEATPYLGGAVRSAELIEPGFVNDVFSAFYPLAAASPAHGAGGLGPNVLVFDPSMGDAAIQAQVDAVFAVQESNQFGDERYALAFMPGTYDIDINVGFYTHVLGLGASPEDVVINGHVTVDAQWFDGNGTQNFWRAAENLTIVPPDGLNRWAVAQAGPMRRVHVKGDMTGLDQPEVIGIVAFAEDPVPRREQHLRGGLSERVQLLSLHPPQEALSYESRCGDLHHATSPPLVSTFSMRPLPRGLQGRRARWSRDLSPCRT